MTIQQIVSQFHGNEPQVIYFVGTFDPFHKGHKSAINKALKKTAADYVVVVPDKSPNELKPNRSPFEDRYNIIQQSFKSKKNVFVTTSLKGEVLSTLLKVSKVIYLLGSDVWNYYYRFRNHEQLFYEKILICIRDSEKNEYPNFLNNIPVEVITSKYQGCSSTKIRELIYKNRSHINLLPLQADAISYIVKNRLYLANSDIIKSQISKILDIPSKEVVQLNKGLFGDLTFRAKEFFFRSYMAKNWKERNENEVKAIKFIDQLKLKSVKTSQLHYYIVDEKHALIGVDFNNDTNFNRGDKMPQICFYIGKALRELHLNGSQKPTRDFLYHLQNKLEKKFLKSFSGPTRCIHQYVKLENSFLKNPGEIVSVHGDANPGNFFVNFEKEEVTLTDLSKFGKNFAAYEYHKFLSSLKNNRTKYHLDDQTVKECSEQFKKGYDKGSFFTVEADRFFDFFWSQR